MLGHTTAVTSTATNQSSQGATHVLCLSAQSGSILLGWTPVGLWHVEALSGKLSGPLEMTTSGAMLKP